MHRGLVTLRVEKLRLELWLKGLLLILLLIAHLLHTHHWLLHAHHRLLHTHHWLLHAHHLLLHAHHGLLIAHHWLLHGHVLRLSQIGLKSSLVCHVSLHGILLCARLGLHRHASHDFIQLADRVQGFRRGLLSRLRWSLGLDGLRGHLLFGGAC